MMKRCLMLSAAALASAAALSCTAFADGDRTKAAEYLSEYFHVEPFSVLDGTETETVNAALQALGGNALESSDIDENALVAEGIRIAGLEELALSYENEAHPDKAIEHIAAVFPTVSAEEGAESSLRDQAEPVAEIPTDSAAESRAEVAVEATVTSDEYTPYIACALDLGLLDGEGGHDVEEYLYRCLEIAGRGRHYIGRISDENILSELYTAMNEQILFDEETLNEVGKQIVLRGAATGYNLKYSKSSADFLADYTLRYGHSDYTHAVQLVGLLKSEDMDGYIQVEPKVSVYEYMPEWGDPGDPTPIYAVREVSEGRFLCYAVEYDLVIEFDTLEEKNAFHQLIEDYAKKYDDRVDEDGNVTARLLAESWWQPLYSSLTEMENPEYSELVDNVIYDETGNYSIHSFTLPGDSGKVADVVKEAAPGLEVSPAAIYVNPAFVRYLTGEDYQ